MGNQVGFYFKSDWLRKQRELSEPITWRSKQNQSHPTDTASHFTGLHPHMDDHTATQLKIL